VAELKAAANTSTPTTPISSNLYIVVPGDNLMGIARKLYGNPYLYVKLIELNKDTYPSLLDNPNLIYAGWQLKY